MKIHFFFPDIKQNGDSLNKSALDICLMHDLNKSIMMAKHVNMLILIIILIP